MNVETVRKLEPILNQLTYEELVVLNQLVVGRVRMMQKAGALVHLSKFNVGDRVFWIGKDGSDMRGVIARLNQKTASIITDKNGQWNVSPQLLRKEETTGTGGTNNLQTI